MIELQVPIEQEDTMYGVYSGSVQYGVEISKLFDECIICTLCEQETGSWEEFHAHMVGRHHSSQGPSNPISKHIENDDKDDEHDDGGGLMKELKCMGNKVKNLEGKLKEVNEP